MKKNKKEIKGFCEIYLDCKKIFYFNTYSIKMRTKNHIFKKLVFNKKYKKKFLELKRNTEIIKNMIKDLKVDLGGNHIFKRNF